MTDDRELLQLAAKAGGYQYMPANGCIVVDGIPGRWNPLEDDGDALRLAVKLKLCFGPNFDGDLAVCFGDNGRNITEAFGADHYAATRRAITRAAAEIQLAKESGK